MSIMKYILISICCFVLSSCVSIPVGDHLYNPVKCIEPCSETELDSESERITDMVVKNGGSVYKREELNKSNIKAEDIINDTSFNIFYLEYDEYGKKLDGNRQLDLIKRAIKNSDKPVYLIVYANSWHNNAYTEKGLTEEEKKIKKIKNMEETKEVKYFPNMLARRSFQNPDKNVIGVYIGWQGEKYKHIPANLLRPKEVADIADRIGKNGEVRTDIISLANDVQNTDQLGYSLIIGKSFGGRLLSRAFMNDLIQMKSVKDWHLGSRSLLVTLNPAIGANAFDEVYENMPGAGADLQRPVWLNLTSEDDRGTSWLFPAARYIAQNLSDKPKDLDRKRINKTTGHYMPHLSHWVTVQGLNTTDSEILDSTKYDTEWFKLPVRMKNDCTNNEYLGNVTRHKYRYDEYNLQYVTALRPLCQGTNKDLGYIWNFQTDESVIADGGATNLISRTAGYHSADVQTILGHMLDDMLFTPPEKPL